MKVVVPKSVRAGKSSKVTIVAGEGVVQVRWLVHDALVHSFECPDPPCHDTYFIPHAYSGSQLIIAFHDQVEEARYTYKIGLVDEDEGLQIKGVVAG